MNLKAVILTGATGYLGAHMLFSLITMYKSEVFCLIRGENEKKCLERLYETLNFYYDSDIISEIMRRVHILCGDITLKDLGLKDDIAAEIKTLFHCAAKTDHYGMGRRF